MTAALSSSDFTFLRELLAAQCGLQLDDARRSFVEGRLLPLALTEQLPDLPALLARLRREPAAELARRVIEALTVHETRFFRDGPAFDALENRVLPDLIERRRGEKALSIWCAACSTGQEAYSLAMILKGRFPELDGWKVRILATDLSSAALQRGRAGLYTPLEVSRGAPGKRLQPWLRAVQGSDQLEVVEPVRRLVEFRSLNLAAPWPSLPPMDLVLLRNVLIYFGAETRARILGSVQKLLKPGGALLLGSGELAAAEPGLEPMTAGGALFFRSRQKEQAWSS